jgi:hypothetical protein
VSQPTNDPILEDRNYITLILRLALDRSGRLIQGELVDTTDTVQKRFTDALGLNQAVATWLRQQEQVEAAPEAMTTHSQK